MKQQFHVHVDNIVEFERLLGTIVRAFGVADIDVSGPHGSLVCPRFTVTIGRDNLELEFTALPGYGRWDCDILDQLRDRGATLREVADAVVTRLASGVETPLLAVEFCGALPAGNQAWQRSGRAFSFSTARVPYFYVAELGGYELDAHRQRKAPRLPNPAVPFSYVTNTISAPEASLPVFVMSAGAHPDDIAAFATAMGEPEFYACIRGLFLGQEVHEHEDILKEKAMAFVAYRAGSARKGSTLAPQQWTAAYTAGEGGVALPNYLLRESAIKWAKIAYIADLTKTASDLMAAAASNARGLTSSELPMCLVAAGDRKAFAAAVEKIYGGLDKSFKEWLLRNCPLTICWVMGFKPRGDDARPDRGLPPLARMLIGPDQDLLCVVYGPAPSTTWGRLDRNPQLLATQNGLWESVFAASDALFVDSATQMTSARRTYLKEHWAKVGPQLSFQPCVATTVPQSFGEQDVDTALHLALSRLAGPTVYEGMCNPPGGDWSGLSILASDRLVEYRWLTLPRVGKNSAKRPDHVFQIFRRDDRPILLVVESKDTPRSIETAVGPRLIDYIRDLLAAPPSVQRPFVRDGSWAHGTSHVSLIEFEVCSAVAMQSAIKSDLSLALTKANADLAIGLKFDKDGKGGSMTLLAASSVAIAVASFLEGCDFRPLGLRVTAGHS